MMFSKEDITKSALLQTLQVKITKFLHRDFCHFLTKSIPVNQKIIAQSHILYYQNVTRNHLISVENIYGKNQVSLACDQRTPN